MHESNEWDSLNVRVVPIDSCFIDDGEYGYQRDRRPRFVDRKSRDDEFEVRLVGVLLGSEREDGRIAILDGQQRMAILVKRGFRTIPAYVLTGLTRQEEARLFADLNFERNTVSSWDHYKALRVACDPVVEAVDRIASQHGLVVAVALDRFYRIGACEAVVAIARGDRSVTSHSCVLDGPTNLDRVFTAIKGWEKGTDFKTAKTSAILRGVARWLSENTDIAASTLADVLKGTTPSATLQSAREISKADTSGQGRGVEAAIAELWNLHMCRAAEAVRSRHARSAAA